MERSTYLNDLAVVAIMLTTERATELVGCLPGEVEADGKIIL